MSKVKLHCMVDLETMSTASDAAIVSLGAVLFNQEEGIVGKFYTNICLQSCIDAGARIDGDTVMFWLKQSEKARATLYTAENKLCLCEALKDFGNWLVANSNVSTLCMWGNGASFDNSILATAYRHIGDQPWKFYNDRCYRTVKNLYPSVKLQRVGELHHALDDAMSQALHLLAIAKQEGLTL